MMDRRNDVDVSSGMLVICVPAWIVLVYKVYYVCVPGVYSQQLQALKVNKMQD